MAIQPISQVGEKVIRGKARLVTRADKKRIGSVIQDMRDSMHATDLVGIAAPQVGIGLRIFLSEVRTTKVRNKLKEIDAERVFINPRITWRSKKQTVLEEGCGSVCHATLFGPVKRPAEVTVEALDENFAPFTLTASGLLAKIIQHELDHLEGIVILDKFIDTRTCWVRER